MLGWLCRGTGGGGWLVAVGKKREMEQVPGLFCFTRAATLSN